MGACAVDQRGVGSHAGAHGAHVIRVQVTGQTYVISFEHLGIGSASSEYDVIASVAGYFDSTYHYFSEHTLVRYADGSLSLVRE